MYSVALVVLCCCKFASTWYTVSCRPAASLRVAPLPTMWLSWCPCLVTLTHPNLRPAQVMPNGYLRRVPWNGPSNPSQWVTLLSHFNHIILFSTWWCKICNTQYNFVIFIKTIHFSHSSGLAILSKRTGTQSLKSLRYESILLKAEVFSKNPFFFLS